MDKLKELLIDYSIQMNVSSLRKDTLDLLLDIIEKNDVKNILEIGTGVGYSSYCIISKYNHVIIDTIEKSEERCNLAKKLLADYKCINIINADCFSFHSAKKYDLIIIDGPKRNQIELFNRLKKFSNSKTIFFIDNIKLDKIRSIAIKNKNQQKIIESIDEFNHFLKNNQTIKFKYYDLDDGVMIGCEKWN